jgi:hypothetical protein
VRSPDDVRELVTDRFDRAFPDWARQRGNWPWRLNLHPPSTEDRLADPVACHTWAALWRNYQGPGTVEFASLRFPTGIHQLPKTITFAGPHDAAAIHPASEVRWLRCGARLTTLQRHFPKADFTGVVRVITDLDAEDYERLDAAVAWLQVNPTSGMLLRQLPIEGIDTKWLARHSRLVLGLLGDDNAAVEADEVATGPEAVSRRRALHRRLGLRMPPELIQIAVLCPALRRQVGGMRHFAASTDDLNRWTETPPTVVIMENKETGYAITDDHPGVVVLHGEGFDVTSYGRIGWVREAQIVIYWGDIDLPGLHFLNDLRAQDIPACSVLMDMTTLDRFRHLAVDGAALARTAVPNLTTDEHALYAVLAEHARSHPQGLLLEQERIPWVHAYEALCAAIKPDP